MLLDYHKYKKNKNNSILKYNNQQPKYQNYTNIAAITSNNKDFNLKSFKFKKVNIAKVTSS